MNKQSSQSNEKFSLTPYYWRCQFSGMAIYWLMIVYTGNLSLGNGDETLARLCARYGVYIFWILAASHLIRHWIKKYQWLNQDVKGFWQRILAVSFFVGVLLTIVQWPFDLLIDYLLPPPETRSQIIIDLENSLSIRIGFSGIYNAMTLLGWTLIYWAAHMWYKTIQMKLTNQALMIEQKSAELSHLQSQVNPHFLFNSLNNIRGLIHLDADKASELITELSDLLRYSLVHNQDLVSLEKELEIVECFLNLEKVRLCDRLSIKQTIDSKCLHFMVPPMLLQSLVENAVKHGISPNKHGGLLSIDCQSMTGGLKVTVSNDGQLPPHITGLGVGLKNSRQRLNLLFGEKSELTLEQQNDKVVAQVFIPQVDLREPQ